MEKTLLDTVTERFAADQARRDTGQPPAPECDGQLSLFDVSEDGSTLVSLDGETI